MLVLPAGHDELVRQPHAAELEDVCKDGGMDVRRVVVNGALRHEVLGKRECRQALVSFLSNMAEENQPRLGLFAIAAQRNNIPERPKREHVSNPVGPREEHTQPVDAATPASSRRQSPL